MGARTLVRSTLWKAGLDVKRAVTYTRTQTIMVRNERDDALLDTVLASVLRADSSCVDIGAHTGSITSLFRRLAPHGRHLAVEPIPELAAGLRRRFPELDVRECAVGARNGTVSFTHVPDASFLSGLTGTALSTYATNTLQVEQRTLDDLLDGRRVDLVKIDVEGAELDVLRGAEQTIRSHRPVVVFEHTRIRFGAGLQAVDGPLDLELHDGLFQVLTGDHGYRLFDLEGHGPLDRESFRQLYESAEQFNFLATP